MHKLHSVLVSFHRRNLTQVAIDTYLETVTLPHTLVVVDNGSDGHVREWLSIYAKQHGFTLVLLPSNRYPGFATNRGWEHAPADATLLHRIDNDFRFLDDWCDEMTRMFDLNPRLGQLGLRTDEEELFAPTNVGGNCVIRRAVWDEGLRYDERPWKDYPQGHTEDSEFTPRLVAHGWEWDRVEFPCIVCEETPDLDDPYYYETFRVRRILPHQLPK